MSNLRKSIQQFKAPSPEHWKHPKQIFNLLNSLANVVMDNRLALDYLLAKQGSVGAIINKIYDTYVNISVQIKKNIKKIYE